MLNYTADEATSQFVDKGVHMARSDQPLMQDRVGHSGYTDGQKAVIEYLCRQELDDLGHAPHLGPMPLLQQAYLSAAATGIDLAWAGLRLSRKLRGQL
jgi:hypothetical protein